jgi:nicotinamide mononucleotide (NMN) deamidase PncC
MYPKLLKKDISLVMAITGGGAEAISLLTQHGGASKILLEAHVPYSAKASSEYAGKEPEHFCSRDHALNLAVSSYNRARAHGTGKFCMGLGSTARLIVDNEREGRVHEAWIAIHDDENTRTYHVSFPKDWRFVQEKRLAEIILRKLEDANGIDNSYDIVTQLGKASSYDDYEQYIVPMVQCKPDIFKHLYEDEPSYYLNLKDKSNISPHSWLIVFPGSFNPIHAQHKKMAEVAHKLTGRKVVFELCVKNTDKPPLDYMRLVERYEAVSRLYDEPYFGGVLITNTPLFVDKAQVTGFKHFMMGMDTAERLISPFYGDVSDTLNIVERNDLHFLIFDRGIRKNDVTFTKRDFVSSLIGSYPYVNIKDRFTIVQPELYTDNGISSTQLRKEQNVH